VDETEYFQQKSAQLFLNKCEVARLIYIGKILNRIYTQIYKSIAGVYIDLSKHEVKRIMAEEQSKYRNKLSQLKKQYYIK
jgi:hypothetical protein